MPETSSVQAERSCYAPGEWEDWDAVMWKRTSETGKKEEIARGDSKER